MIVTVSVLSGLTKAYRSVESIWGSADTSGASRWLDAPLGDGPRPVTSPTPRATVATTETVMVRKRLPLGKEVPSSLFVENDLAAPHPAGLSGTGPSHPPLPW